MNTIVLKSMHKVLLVLAVCLFAACSTDVVDEVNEGLPRSMKMNFRVNVKQFDSGGATRGGDASAWEWEDGATVYIQYYVGTKRVRGHAVYSKETDSWEAFYNGTLGTDDKCEVYFFEGVSTSDKKSVKLTGAESVYGDLQGSYNVNNGELILSANLAPLTSRIKFSGSQGTKIQVSGIKFYTGYDAETNTLTTSTEALSRTVAADGYTPYIYGVFADTEKRELSIFNSIDGDDIYFVRSFPSSVLRIGDSGYMTIPTSDTNKGWTRKVIPKLSVSPTTLTFGSVASSQTVTVTTNISYTVSSSATWCTATPSSDGKTLSIAVTENTGDNSRSATVMLKHEESGLTAKINISQHVVSYTFTVFGNGKTVSFNMIEVEAGTFQMGSELSNEEKPVHQVTLTRDYYMGETEVTQALWYAVMGQSPISDGDKWSSTYGYGDNYPAYYLSYNDIIPFLIELNTVLAEQLPTGMQFRLPTEAEWEFAAKGGNKRKGNRYSGSNNEDDVAWYSGNSNSRTHLVKTKASNELGLFDMSGNVGEWCYDWYSSYSSSAQTDPTGPTSGYSRVSRGSNWLNNAWFCRPTSRNSNSPESRYSTIGFRLAM